MNLHPDPADREFSAEVRGCVEQKLRELFPNSEHKGGFNVFNRERVQRWTRALNEKGWAVPQWPVEWGGVAWPPTWGPILDDELVRAEAPSLDVISTGFVGPVIYTFGTQEQKQRFLPRIRNADDFWCQGFSESNAGSDVTSLRTFAIQSGDELIVNGQKLWTTNAHNADMMFTLVRIDGAGNRRQRGLSFVLIDMRTPGITVRPIITIDGRHVVNEVFIDNVHVPVENVVGEQGKGWIYARFLLARERTIVAQLSVIRRLVAILKSAIRSETVAGTTLGGDPIYCSRLARMEIELHALEFLELRMLHAPQDDHQAQSLGPMLKLRGCELRQRASDFLLEVFGESALEFDAPHFPSSNAPPIDNRLRLIGTNFLSQRAATIAGGTSEVQRNIIAATMLES